MDRKRKIFVIISWLLVFALGVFIFMMSSADAEQSANMSNGILRKIIEFTGLNLSSHFIRKTAHFCEFALLSFLMTNAVFVTWQKKYAPVIAFPVSCIYAVTDEVHQLFSEGRACQFRDMLIDSSGALLGALIYSVIILIYIKRIERNKENGSIETL